MGFGTLVCPRNQTMHPYWPYLVWGKGTFRSDMLHFFLNIDHATMMSFFKIDSAVPLYIVRWLNKNLLKSSKNRRNWNGFLFIINVVFNYFRFTTNLSKRKTLTKTKFSIVLFIYFFLTYLVVIYWLTGKELPSILKSHVTI